MLVPLPLELWLVIIAANIYTIGKAVTRGHGVDGTLAWLFAILAFPGLGAVAYLLLANPNIERTTRRKRLAADAARRALKARLAAERGAVEPPKLILPDERLVQLTTSLTGLPPSVGNRVKLLAEQTSCFQEIEETLLAAKQSIWAEFYIIKRDETGERFLEILIQKAKQGLDVRLIYDAFGSLHWKSKSFDDLAQAGGKLAAFLPMNPFQRRWAVHLRNHRKIIVVDGKVSFTGGMNIGNEYSGRVGRSGNPVFRDTHLRLEGPATGDIAQVFAEDWAFATGDAPLEVTMPAPIERATSIVSVVPSGPDQTYNASGMAYFAAIATAQKRICLTSPYFVPDEPTYQALISAALSGVEVYVLVPSNSDARIVGAAGRSYYARLLRSGARVFEYEACGLHAKTLLIDHSLSLVGSANMDIRSFRFNFELGALIMEEDFATQMEACFFADLEKSREITVEAIQKRTFGQRLRDGGARLLSPLL